MDQVAEIAFIVSVWVLPVLLAVTLHEAAHGYAAWVLGDPTAKTMGRVTLNPIAHIDRFGTVILPGLLLLLGSKFLFGYAKPVPVNFGRLGHPKRDMIIVAAAGPAANIFLALMAAVMIWIVPITPDVARDWLFLNLWNALQLNLILAVFNMLPVPPLDGGRILTGLLPMPLAIRFASLEKVGMVLIIGIIFLLPFVGSQLGYDLNILGWLVGAPAMFLRDLILTGLGLEGLAA